MRVKVAVVGAGSMGMNHLRVLKDFDEERGQLVGVAETHEPALKRAIGRFHVAGYTDYHQMIAQTCPDLVAIVVPTHLHYAIASYVLEQGIHVLIEKPLTATVEEALALLQLARLHNAKIAVGHVERFNPAIVELKRRLLSGSL